MSRKNAKRGCVPVTGGIDPPARLTRALPAAPVPASQLDRHITRLLKLHPDACARFQGVDLDAMDDTAKRTLLDDINALLGISSSTPS